MDKTQPRAKGTTDNVKIAFWRQIRWTLIFYFVALATIPVLVVGYLMLTRTQAQTVEQVTHQLESVATLKQDQIERWLGTGELALDSYLSDATVLALFRGFINTSQRSFNETLQSQVSTSLRNAISIQSGQDFPFSEFFLYDTQGRILASSDEVQVGKVVSLQPYFESSLTGNYIQSPYYEVGTGELNMLITRPILGTGDTVIGAIAGRLKLDTLGQIMVERTGLGESGETYLVSIENSYLLTPSRFEGYETNRAYRSLAIDSALAGQTGTGNYDGYRGVSVIGAYRWLPEINAALIAEIDQSEALAPFAQTAGINLAVVLVTTVVGVALAFYVATRISNPLVALTRLAGRIASGDLHQRLQSNERNEVGVLAQTFNSMADQLEDLITGLETRIAERTQHLATTIEVGKLATSIYSQEELLPRLVEFIRLRFALYYTQIYLVDEALRYATLYAATGETGKQLLERNHRLDLNQTSLVGTAVQTRQSVLVTDTETSPIHKANPLLPNTRSELAIPLIAAADILGVLDMQADKPGTFNEENLPVYEAMASQIAAVMQGARVYDAAQAATETAEDIIRRLTGEQWTPYLGRLAQGKRIGYQYDLETPTELDVEGLFQNAENVLQQAVMVRGQQIGSIVLKDDTKPEWTAEEQALVEGVAERVALSLEQFRAFDEARTTAEERQILYQIARKLTDARSAEELLDAVVDYAKQKDLDSATMMYIDTNESNKPEWAEITAQWNLEGSTPTTAQVGSRFYLPEFPFSHFWISNPDAPTFVDDVMTSEVVDEATRALLEMSNIRSMALLPLYKQGQWVGLMTLSSRDVYHFTEQDERILTAVANQATSQAEALRAAELTEKHASELETVAMVSAATTSILNIEELLQSVVDLTRDSFGLYHAHIYLLEDTRENLVLAAGAGEPGQLMKERGHRIPVNHPHSLVARAARAQQPVISNDVTNDPDFLPNPLLPETKSEVAISMIVAGEVIGVLDVQSDVTNRFKEDDVRIKTTLADQIAVAVQNARAFAETEARAERLREIDRLKSQFLANMSHELRTPLNSIIGYSEVLLDGVDGDLTEDASEDVQAIHDSGKHLLSIINEILDLAKIEAGQMQLDRKPVKLSDFVQEIVKAGQILVKDKPVVLNWMEDSPIEVEVMADAIRLRQIMWNLVSNGVKFTEEGGVTVAYGMHNDHEAYIKVTDTGIGISEEGMSIIFQRFRQADGSSTRRAGGTGLGLTITRELIQMHGGDIHVESEVGVGSTFWFTLPVKRTEVVEN